ncbi:MAG: hypothetical protein ACOX1S_11040 [Anaerostipes sp.]|jgi:hypothetical protein
MVNRIKRIIGYLGCIVSGCFLYYMLLHLSSIYMLPDTNLYFMGIFPILITLYICSLKQSARNRVFRHICYFPLLPGAVFYLIFTGLGWKNGSLGKVQVFFLGFLLIGLCLGMAMFVSYTTVFFPYDKLKWIHCAAIFLGTRWIFQCFQDNRKCGWWLLIANIALLFYWERGQYES